MLGRNITITCADPACGQQIRVIIRNGQASWRPETAVVFVGSDVTAASARAACWPPGTAEPSSRSRRPTSAAG
jgi:hypothetical protein